MKYLNTRIIVSDGSMCHKLTEKTVTHNWLKDILQYYHQCSRQSSFTHAKLLLVAVAQDSSATQLSLFLCASLSFATASVPVAAPAALCSIALRCIAVVVGDDRDRLLVTAMATLADNEADAEEGEEVAAAVGGARARLVAEAATMQARVDPLRQQHQLRKAQATTALRMQATAGAHRLRDLVCSATARDRVDAVGDDLRQPS